MDDRLTALNRAPRLAEIKISYRRRKPPACKACRLPPALLSPSDAAAYFRAVWNPRTLELVEDFVVVCMNSALEPLGWIRAASGGMESCIVDPKVVFAVALQTAATAIAVAHNHPSGLLEQSKEDLAITNQLIRGSTILGIRFLDHIILTTSGAYSITERKAL